GEPLNIGFGEYIGPSNCGRYGGGDDGSETAKACRSTRAAQPCRTWGRCCRRQRASTSDASGKFYSTPCSL
ncbi:hypothetical protein L2E82_26539, partial [Cichorium intybus]